MRRMGIHADNPAIVTRRRRCGVTSDSYAEALSSGMLRRGWAQPTRRFLWVIMSHGTGDLRRAHLTTMGNSAGDRVGALVTVGAVPHTRILSVSWSAVPSNTSVLRLAPPAI